MSEPENHQDDSHAYSSKPSDNSRWLKIRNWLIRIGVIMVLLSIEKVVEHVSLRELTELNSSFVNGVQEVDPFGLARLFYDYLLHGAPREPPPTLYGFQIPRSEPPESVGFGTVLYRIIPGAFYTARIIVSKGWVSTLTALVAVFLGFACMWSSLKEEESLYSKLLMLLAVPLIGSVFVWVLLKIMWIAGLLFGHLLVSAQTIAYFSVVGACAEAVVKEQEHHFTSKIIARLTARH